MAPKKTTAHEKPVKKVVSKKKASKKGALSVETDSPSVVPPATAEDICTLEIPDDIIILDDGTLSVVSEEVNEVPSAESITAPADTFRCNRIASCSTLVGLQVTCQVALKLSDFLIDSCGYIFVMLTRINQDNLEVRTKYCINLKFTTGI